MSGQWMINSNDPARQEIASRAQALGIVGTPDKAAHHLGPIMLADGTMVQAHVVHAVDPIITDGTHVVMINRRNDPGLGKPALPGGFIDPAQGGGIESAVQAAAREAMEEVGIDLDSNASTLIGTRNMNRPFDVRIASNDGLEKTYGIKKGDIFMVSTQAVRFDVPDLTHKTLSAGDDAEPGTARLMKITSLSKKDLGVADHFDMIQAAFSNHLEEKMTKLKIVTTDFGADCDDQKAISDLIESRDTTATTLAFIVSGPHPHLAAQAIAEKYHAKFNAYPLIALGKQFEDDKKAAEEIFSLTDGLPMTEKPALAPVLTLEDLQTAIDSEITSGKYDQFEQIVLAPVHSTLEYYNPGRASAIADAALQKQWNHIQKLATLQFQRTEDGHCKGNNYQKSAPGVADDLLSLLEQNSIETVFFDGAVSKLPEFLMRVTQDKQIGLQKAAESYIAAMQVPWLYMTEPMGVTPSAPALHAGMFTAASQFPFGVHVSAGTPAGFGAERALKEICGITRDDPEKFAAAFKPIAEELERFDSAVLQSLQQQHPSVTSVAQMREEMHQGMLKALQRFAEQKGIVKPEEKIETFTDLFAEAKNKEVKLNPYGFMSEFEKTLFTVSPLIKDITTLAVAEARRPHNGQNHIQIMSSALAAHGARATVYDAVTIAAADVIRENGELRPFFNKKADTRAPVIDVSVAAIQQLKVDRSDLYAAFVNGIRERLTLDGTALAQPKAQPVPQM